MMRRIFSLWLVLVVIVTLSVPLSNAQTSATATIVGRLLDPQGAVVAGATVVAKNVETGIERTTQSNAEGLYRFDSLPPGLYDLRSTAQGFAKAEVKGVKLQVGEQRDVNFNLTVGGAAVVIDVTAAAPLVETGKTDVSNTVTTNRWPRCR